MDFYTSVFPYGNTLLVRGIENGKRIHKKVKYKPTLYVEDRQGEGEGDYRTLTGDPVLPWEFDTMRDARNFAKEYAEVENFPIYGNLRFQYVWIYENFPKEISFDQKKIRLANIDIEVESDDGFPEPDKATKPITAIAMKYNGEFFVFGYGDYTPHMDNVNYLRLENEQELLRKFLAMWRRIDPDIVTGWNIQFFDIPYLYNRIKFLLGEEVANGLSPWKLILERTTTIMGKTQQCFDITGVATLDYLEMFKKYEKQQESYRLDHIAHVVLGENKMDYSEYGNLTNLYKENHQKFIEYNILDVDLVDRIDKKKKLIDQVLAIAYDAHVNYGDVFTQVRMWDTIIHNYLMDHKIVIPQMENSSKDTAYEGAYVKEPQPGLYHWVVSFDLTSMYPHLIRQYNLGPETLIPDEHSGLQVNDVLSRSETLTKATERAQELGASVAANGFFFSNSRISFLNDLMGKMYSKRKSYKKMMLDTGTELEYIKEELNRRGFDPEKV